MQNLVVFSSLTGNTEKVAKSIFSVLKNDKKIINLKDFELDKEKLENTINNDIENSKNIIIGYWIDKGDADENMLNFMSKIKNKNISLFITMGGNPHSEHAKKCINKRKEELEKNGNIIEKIFVCQGGIDPKLLEKFREMTKQGIKGFHEATPEAEARWAIASKHPDENDLENAKKIFEGY